MEKSFYDIRIKKLVEILKKKQINSYICGLSTDMYYLTGYHAPQSERFTGLFISLQDPPILIVPEMNLNQIRENVSIKNIITWNESEDPFQKLAWIIEERNLSKSTIAVEDTLWSKFLLAFQEKLSKVKFISGSRLVSGLRRIKTNHEKDLMMNIGIITDQVMEKAISKIQVGVTELKIANLIENTFKEFGVKYGGDVPLVASGPYSAQPHYSATEKVIGEGESVIMDFGGIWERYRSDMTRTVFVGNPPKEYLKIYNTVKQAQEAGKQSIKPGRTCEEIDRIVRNIIKEKGYSQYFIHRTGHGIGLDFHEEPYIVEGNKTVLEPGMTFSIEPGIYISGKYGVRIEDCVIVTKEGSESFTNLNHDLISI